MKRTASTMLRRATNGARCAGDRRVVITGGSSGVGVALVAALLQREGRGQIYVTGTRPFEDTQLCEMLRERSEDDAERVRYSVGDTGCTEAVAAQMADAVQFFEGLPPDALFLNAGIGGGRYQLEDLDVDRFDAIMRTNVRGVFLWLRAALPLLKKLEEPSQIVVTSSVLGNRATTQAAAYCASKFAVNGMVLSLRQDLRSAHPLIKVGLVCPAAIATPWWDEPGRSGAFKATPKPTALLSADAVAEACISLVEQLPSSNIEQLNLEAVEGSASCV